MEIEYNNSQISESVYVVINHNDTNLDLLHSLFNLNETKYKIIRSDSLRIGFVLDYFNTINTKIDLLEELLLKILSYLTKNERIEVERFINSNITKRFINNRNL